MGVRATDEQAQVRHLLAGQGAFLGQHALDGLFHDALGEAAVQDLLGGGFLDPARVAGVTIVDLVGRLLAGEHHLVDVGHDDIVTAIDVGGVVGAVLAAQAVGDEGREAAHHDAFGVDVDPLLLDIGRLQRSRGALQHVWRS